ncbi:MAG: hypothetical protein Ct9H90mP21_2700 [Methanobacteriota archaeon]|nr:MAG: hypothetical protein Ct9H90mP21_2700 [Euryarchaeota archaeon]
MRIRDPHRSGGSTEIEEGPGEVCRPQRSGNRNVLDAIDSSGTVSCLGLHLLYGCDQTGSWKDGQTLTTDTWAEDAKIEENPYGLAKSALRG